MVSSNIHLPKFLFLPASLGLFVVLCLLWIYYPDQVNPYFNQNSYFLSALYYGAVLLGFISLVYFGRRIFREDEASKMDMPFFLIFFLSSVLLYLGSFHTKLAPNGDNAEYIINARSLVDYGGVYRLDTPSRTPNTLASLGLPLLLAPIYKIWGLHFLPMKLLVLLMSLANGVLLIIFFRQEYSLPRSVFLAMVSFSSPYLIANSNTIMTEGPYLFWSLLAIIFIRRYARNRRFAWKDYIPMIFFLFYAYLTRAVGVALFVAAFLFLVLNHDSKDGPGSPGRWDIKKWSKILWFTLPFLTGILYWQISRTGSSISPVQMFLDMDFTNLYTDNLTAFKNVVGQMFFSPSSFRWYKQSADFILPAFNPGWFLILCFILFAIFHDLYRRRLAAMYTLGLISVLILASQTPQERVFIRYLSVLIPFFIYHIHSLIYHFELRLKSSANIGIARYSSVLTFILIGLIYIGHLSSNRYNVLTKGAVYNAYYDSFLKAARWCGENLPPDAYIMSVKPRIVYLYSDLPGRFLVGDRDVYSPAYEQEKLKEIKDYQVTHIIVDAISRATIENIHPIIQNNPDKFEKLPVPGLEDKCTVIRVRSF